MEDVSPILAKNDSRASYVIIALLAVKRASEAALEVLGSTDAELGGGFSFSHGGSGGESNEEGEDGDL